MKRIMLVALVSIAPFALFADENPIIGGRLTRLLDEHAKKTVERFEPSQIKYNFWLGFVANLLSDTSLEQKALHNGIAAVFALALNTIIFKEQEAALSGNITVFEPQPNSVNVDYAVSKMPYDVIKKYPHTQELFFAAKSLTWYMLGAVAGHLARVGLLKTKEAMRDLYYGYVTPHVQQQPEPESAAPAHVEPLQEDMPQCLENA